MAAGSLRNSRYTLSAGPSAEEFHDLDQFAAGRTERTSDDQESSRVSLPLGSDSQIFADCLAVMITRIAEQYGVRRLAFVEKGDIRGPVGLLTFMAALIERTKIPAVIVRLGRKLPSAKVKGPPVIPGEGFLLLSDVATSGETIAEAAKAIWQQGGKVPVALAVYDRQQGAIRNLRAIDIDLCAVYNHSYLRKNNLSDIDAFEVIDRDFGGRSVTV